MNASPHQRSHTSPSCLTHSSVTTISQQTDHTAHEGRQHPPACQQTVPRAAPASLQQVTRPLSQHQQHFSAAFNENWALVCRTTALPRCTARLAGKAGRAPCILITAPDDIDNCSLQSLAHEVIRRRGPVVCLSIGSGTQTQAFQPAMAACATTCHAQECLLPFAGPAAAGSTGAHCCPSCAHGRTGCCSVPDFPAAAAATAAPRSRAHLWTGWRYSG